MTARWRQALALTFVLASGIAAGGAWAGGEGYFARQSEGWFWYEDPEPLTEEPASKPQQHTPPASAPVAPAADDPGDPRKQLKTLQEQLEYAQAKAVMDPTTENIQAFLAINLAVHKRAERFAQGWQQVLWREPALDTTLVNPVNTNARHVWYDEQERLLAAFLEDTATRYGLWFFFRSDCPFCHKFAPVLRAFAERYGFEVIAVSQDGGALPDFPNPKPDSGIGAKLGVSQVPSVFLVEPRKREVHTVSHGFVGPSDLAYRIFTILEGEPPNPSSRRAAK